MAVETDGLTAGSPSGRSVNVWRYSRVKIMK
jgi:hypothetical protein